MKKIFDWMDRTDEKIDAAIEKATGKQMLVVFVVILVAMALVQGIM